MRICDLSVGMISYCVGTEHLFALLLDGEGELQRFQLARCAEVFPKIDVLMDALGRPLGWVPSRRAAVVRQFTNEWGACLLPPPDSLRRFDILLIVAHHFLHGVPLHLVRFGDKPLAITHGVSYCSSATLLHRCFERNLARRFNPRAWSFPLNSDGAQPAGPPVRTCKSCGADVLTDKDLAYQELAHSFSSHFSETSFGRTRDDVKNALDPQHRIPEAEPAHVAPDVICLVSHGHVDTMHIDRSGLLLLGTLQFVSMRNVRIHGDAILHIRDHPFAEIPLRLEPVRPFIEYKVLFEPEMMTVGELMVQCESDAQLVALFGCSTGSGAVGSNDEYLSLAYQWLKIGAASVIANLWEADLAVLTEWSHRFIKHWVQLRQPKAIAVREATRTLSVDRPDWANQFELWGCMALLGDWL